MVDDELFKLILGRLDSVSDRLASIEGRLDERRGGWAQIWAAVSTVAALIAIGMGLYKH